MKTTIRIAIVAGETSGDMLGAGLIRELKQQYTGNVECYGIGGDLMLREGFQTYADMQKLSIMGFDGLFENLQDILAIRKRLQKQLISNPPDVFIGIDVPDFNLSLEKNLRKENISVIHYVSPTVWAWREYRIHKIRKAVSLMLTLFPFEKKFYQRWQVPVEFVGHPLAQKLKPDFKLSEISKQFQQFKQSNTDNRIIAVLPGSRSSEVNSLGNLFYDAIWQIHKEKGDVVFVVPVANSKVADKLNSLLEEHAQQQNLKKIIHFFDGEFSADIMRISDVVLLASGTAALESALLAKPTVVAYKVSWLTYWFARMTAKVKYASMPNHLLDQPIIPEFLQSDATVANLSKAVLAFLNDEHYYAQTCKQLATIHAKLNKNADKNAASVVLEYVQKNQSMR